MAFAVELALDRESAGVVRALWRRMAEAGIRFMAESGADPHLSLAIWDRLSIEHAIAEVTALVAATLPLPLSSRLDRMAVVQFRPVRERYSQPLSGR